MSCHDGASPASADSSSSGASTTTLAEPRVALLGNPNVGKSTLFNVLTGARQRVINAPGTTVELATGIWRTPQHRIELVDLPGTYSLLARSVDEQVAADTALGADRHVAPDVVVVTVEAAALPRALYLLGQLLQSETTAGVVVAVTMTDVARTRGIEIPPAELAGILGLPVVACDPRTGAGSRDLADAVDRLLNHETPTRPDALARPVSHEGVDGAEAVFSWVQQVLEELGPTATGPSGTARVTVSDRVDQVLLNPWFGVPVFGVVMWAMFQLATVVAAPVMDAVDALFSTLGGWLTSGLEAIASPAWLISFLVDGLLAGVATVFTFVPLLAIVFGAIALLEDSGYLARAAFVADRAMQALGLDGRAMLPLVIGFGCNVPALTATRTLPHARSRLLVGLLIPLTSCPARLTVVLFIASAVFPNSAGTAVFLMYVGSIVMVVLGGLLLRATLFRDIQREGLVLALPAYQRPRLRALAASVWARCLSFITKAGSIIVATLAVVWVLLAVPITGGHTLGDVPVEDSAYGATMHAIAPVFSPAGFGDWHFSAALATGFVAKEVVVGSFAQTFALTEPEDPTAPGDLGAQIVATLERTSGGHASAAAAAFLVYVLAYTPCLATVGEQRRLYGWRWTGAAVVAQLGLAWLLAVAVFRVGVALGGLG